MDKRIYTLMIVAAVIGFAFIINANMPKDSDEVIDELYKAIDEAKANGDYDCCLEPACTMCYLGKWKFEAGTCDCDDAMREGDWESVCPECKAGLEKGLCKSAEGESCPLIIEEKER